MNNEIAKVFNHEEFGQVEVLVRNNKELFKLEDVSFALGYTKIAKGKKYLRKDRVEKVIENAEVSTVVHGGQRYIDEEGLYEFIFESGTDNAKTFRKWVTGVILPSIRKTGGFVANDELFISTYLPFADEQTKVMFRGTLETVRKLNEEVKKKDVIIEEKTEIIEAIADNIPVAEKRKILNRVVKKGKNIQGRYSALYQEFNDQYRMNVQLRHKNYNINNKPKMSSVMEYIDTQLDMIPQLYELAVKLFESDVNKLIQEMYENNELR